jgi:hypothetical protein
VPPAEQEQIGNQIKLLRSAEGTERGTSLVMALLLMNVVGPDVLRMQSAALKLEQVRVDALEHRRAGPAEAGNIARGTPTASAHEIPEWRSVYRVTFSGSPPASRAGSNSRRGKFRKS